MCGGGAGGRAGGGGARAGGRFCKNFVANEVLKSGDIKKSYVSSFKIRTWSEFFGRFSLPVILLKIY